MRQAFRAPEHGEYDLSSPSSNERDGLPHLMSGSRMRSTGLFMRYVGGGAIAGTSSGSIQFFLDSQKRFIDAQQILEELWYREW